jgi:multiple sugar transport system ATP-binding protein
MSIEVREVAKSYGDVVALHQCSLAVADGELMVLVGPSGCGKTTLLRIVAGFLRPDDGIVFIRGKNVNGLPVRDRRLAFIMENLGLYPHLDVFKNVAYPLTVRRVNHNVVDARVREIAETLGIGELLGRRISQLSGGQRQRVAIARALVRNDAEVLLADECFSDLDAQLRYQLRGEFKELQRKNKLPCIFVTHDQEEALSLGERIAVMDRGHIVQVGTADELYKDPCSAFVAGFIGRPPMNLLSARITNECLVMDGTLVGRVSTQAGHRDGDVVFGVRPEDLALSRTLGTGIEAEITWIEHMSPDKLIHLQAGSKKLIARVRDAGLFECGQRVHVDCSEDNRYLFDAVTGERIYESFRKP